MYILNIPNSRVEIQLPGIPIFERKWLALICIIPMQLNLAKEPKNNEKASPDIIVTTEQISCASKIFEFY